MAIIAALMRDGARRGQDMCGFASPVLMARSNSPLSHVRDSHTAPPYCEILKLMLLVNVPPGVVTTTGPVDAAAGTTAVMEVSELIWKPLAAMPLDVTEVLPVS